MTKATGNISNKKNTTAVFIIGLLLFSAAVLISQGTGYGHAGAPEDNGTELSTLAASDQLGILIDGNDITKGCGFEKDFFYLTSAQQKSIKENKSTAGTGIGDSSFVSDRYFSAYELHGIAGGYTYVRADGIDIKDMLENLGVDTENGVSRLTACGNDDYWKSLDTGYIFRSRYAFEPGDSEDPTEVLPMIALYISKNTSSTAEAGSWPGEPQIISGNGNVFLFGQKNETDNIASDYISGVDNIIVGSSSSVLTTGNNSGKTLYMKDLLRLGIYKTSYSYYTDSETVTDNIEGVPFSKVAQRLGLTNYIKPGTGNKLIVTDTEGNTEAEIEAQYADRCFVAWGYTDDKATPADQSGRLMFYMPGTSTDGVRAYDLKDLTVRSTGGQTVSQGVPVLKASPVTGTGNRLAWTSAAYSGGYEIYRAESAAGPFNRIAVISSGNTLSYTDSTCSRGKTYYYRIRSYVTAGSSKSYGAYSSAASSRYFARLGRPSVKLSKIGTRSVKIKWKKISGATGYQIYRATKKNGRYKRIKTLKGSSKISYTNKKLKRHKRYYYKVRAYRLNGSFKDLSSFSKIRSIRR